MIFLIIASLGVIAASVAAIEMFCHPVGGHVGLFWIFAIGALTAIISILSGVIYYGYQLL